MSKSVVFFSKSSEKSFFLIYSSVKIYWCTHKDNQEPEMFVNFCETFLPDHTAVKLDCARDKECVVLVLSVPSLNRLNAYKHFLKRVKETATAYQLDKEGKFYIV